MLTILSSVEKERFNQQIVACPEYVPCMMQACFEW